MEKLIYLLGQPEGKTREQLAEQLTGEIIGDLQQAGASRIRLCLWDSHVEPAAELRTGTLAPTIWCYLAMWVDSRVKHADIKSLLTPVSAFQYGYAVAESEQLFHEWQADGLRVDGMNEVVCLKKPEHLSRQDFLDIWLKSHTQIAIDTQSTFGYVQNIVGDTLDADTPWFDSIVEENFPAAAMTDQAAFYDAVGVPEKHKKNEQIMIDSCVRFIDFESLERMPMSEYNF